MLRSVKIDNLRVLYEGKAMSTSVVHMKYNKTLSINDPNLCENRRVENGQNNSPL